MSAPSVVGVREIERHELVLAPDLLAKLVEPRVQLPRVLAATTLRLDTEVVQKMREPGVDTVGHRLRRGVATEDMDRALAERVEIGGGHRPAARGDLGGAVRLVQRLETLAGMRRVDDGPAPVDEPHQVIAAAHDHVRRIEVAVQDALVVRPAERRERALQDPHDMARGQAGLAAATKHVSDRGEVEAVEAIEHAAEAAVAGPELISGWREGDWGLVPGREH